MQIAENKNVKPGRRRLKDFIDNRDGVAAIEFAMLALPFFLLVFAILETCIAFAAQQVMSNAMDDVARSVRTGQERGLTEEKLKEEICNKLNVITTSCLDNLVVDLRAYPSFPEAAKGGYRVLDPNIVITGGGVETPPGSAPGGALTINTLRVFYKWPVMTDIMRKYMHNIEGNKTLLYATVTWQNEPFDD